MSSRTDVLMQTDLFSSFTPQECEMLALLIEPREFEAGATPEQVAARSIVALRRAGIDNIYLCNLGARQAGRRLDAILDAVAALG